MSISSMRSKPMILGSLLVAAFAINLDTTMVNVALPALVRELHATTTQLQWVVDAYNLVGAARAVMGLGAAMIFPATLSLIVNSFTERRERAMAIGLWGATAGAAIAL